MSIDIKVYVDCHVYSDSLIFRAFYSLADDDNPQRYVILFFPARLVSPLNFLKKVRKMLQCELAHDNCNFDVLDYSFGSSFFDMLLLRK